jgi:hypothetical protein
MDGIINHSSVFYASIKSKMKVCLVTNKGAHHYYWINELAQHVELSQIVLVDIESKKQKKIKRGYKQFGFKWLLLKISSTVFGKLNKKYGMDTSSADFFQFTNKKIQALRNQFAPQITECTTINDEHVIQRIKESKPDLVCFLGGDIAKKKFFEQINVPVLNFHSGISPLYNGSATTFNAIMNGTPNLCGGTLMLMNEKIDGGKMLAHYLTPIEENETGGTLFNKGIIGCVKLYTDFFRFYEQNKAFNSINQGSPLLYFKSNDWTIWEDLKYRSYIQKNIFKKYIRKESVFTYYDQDINTEKMYGQLLTKLLNHDK